MATIAVLEIGGTHATSALVDTRTWTPTTTLHRVQLNGHDTAEVLLTAIADTADGLDAPFWGIAIPDPFDYVNGIGLFRDVGKFESLDGVDVRAELAERLGVTPTTLTFCNDADAFTLGEWVAGAGRGSSRCVGITLGTGVGSGWTVDGRVVDPGVPRGGRIHQLSVDGGPLEDVMSRRAIRRAYVGAGGDDADVREIADRARAGEDRAAKVLEQALNALGRAAAPAITGFGADVVIVGGSMARSWDLLEPWFRGGWLRSGCSGADVPPIRLAVAGEAGPLIGTAYAASLGA